MLACVLGLLCILRIVVAARGKWDAAFMAHVIRALSLVTWPAVYHAVVHPDCRTLPCNAVPIVWLCAATLLDALLAAQGGTLHFEPSMVTATAFGLSALVGARAGGKHTHMILYAFLGCLLCCLPTVKGVPDTSPVKVAVESLQRCTLMWCTGLLIGGALLSHACPSQ